MKRQTAALNDNIPNSATGMSPLLSSGVSGDSVPDMRVRLERCCWASELFILKQSQASEP
jgi:hypothetical protein